MKKMFRPLGEHHVYQDQDRYIKLPKNPHFFLGKGADYCALLQSNVDYIREHFGDLVTVPETIIEHDETHGYRIKQRAIHAKPINLLHYPKDHPLHTTLQDLFDRNRALWSIHHKGLDFYGTDGLHAPHLLHNILLDEGGNLILIDIGLLSSHAINPYFRLASRFFFHLQNTTFFISKHLIGSLVGQVHYIKKLVTTARPRD